LVRINCDEFTEGGITLDDAVAMVPILEEAGVNLFRTDRGTWETYSYMSPPACFPRGCFVHHTAALKKVAKKAKIAAEGRINDPLLAEEILQANKADIIGFGRAFIADPEWPKKAAEGRLDDIRKCIACCRCVDNVFRSVDNVFLPLPAECSANAQVGREKEYVITPAERRKKVVVVGGGPGGMEAARVCALRGHDVSLFTKESMLGGLLILSGIICEEHEDFIKWMASQLKKLGVKIHTGKEVTPSLIDSLKPDVLILATGATPLPPKIRGIDGPNVLSSTLFYKPPSDQAQKAPTKRRKSFRRFLWSSGILALRLFGPSFMRRGLGWGMISGKKVVVIGDELAGVEMAEFFNRKGKKVTMVELPENLIEGVMLKQLPWLEELLRDILSRRGVTLLTNVKYEEVTSKGLVITTEKGERQTIEADIIALTSGSRPNTQLFQQLKGKAPEVYVAGDCAEPAGILEAVREGAKIGRTI